MTDRLAEWWEGFKAASGVSDKKNGGAPEGGRQGNQPMLNVVEERSKAKPVTVEHLFSKTNAAEERRARAWIADRVEKAKGGIISEVVWLTPAMAELLLEVNENNRHLRERKVDDYTTDIKNGDWSLNGESIKIAKDGRLNDGQHRCHAVIKAGRPIQTVVVFGVERSSRMTVDQGAVRTTGNYLAMSGTKSANHVAAIAAWVWRFENGYFLNRRVAPTKMQVAQTAANNPCIVKSLEAIPCGKGVGRSRSVLAFCHFLFAKRSPVHADAFMLRLCLADGLTRRDPIFHCRERLITDRTMRAPEKIELLIRTWNAHRKGKPQTKCSPILGELPSIER